MFKQKLTDKSIMAVLILFGILIVVVVYVLPYRSFSESNISLSAQNEQLNKTIKDLQVYYDNRNQYATETETLRKEIVNIVSVYPSMYRSEDYIMQAIDVEAVSDNISFNAIDIKDAKSLVYIDQTTISSVSIEGLNQPMDFVEQEVTYNNDIDYPSMKQAIAELFLSKYVLNIQRITYTRDESTGKLNGDIIVGYYYVTGTGKDYVAPSIPEYVAGTDNIFGVVIIEEDEEEVNQ